MLINTRLLARVTLGAVLAVSSLSSLAANRSTQFMVMVQVLPHCQWSLVPQDAGGGQFAINCTRNTGYSVSLAQGGESRPDAHPNPMNGVGTGTRQVVPLHVPTAASTDAGLPNNAPLFLTISY